MARSLLIGLGGTGSGIVNRVMHELNENDIVIDDGEISCAVLDTDSNDNARIVKSNAGVPVISTGQSCTIGEYFNIYHYLGIEEWCPSFPAFLNEDTVTGASAFRVKSRAAFMNCVESGELEKKMRPIINKVLSNNYNVNTRVMIVCSLAGGTGSGMFIQFALWLRRAFGNAPVTIRGIFILPDVFVQTLNSISNNKITMTRQYSNAYAAIRELNAITSVLKSKEFKLPKKIKIGDLFDSDRDAGKGVPVYDFAFFVDDEDKNGITLNSIGEYEQLVAQLVYMQIHAPMKNDMMSEEDNLFLPHNAKPTPYYGSCGVAKAIYPTKSVKDYCTLRAVQDSLTKGWGRIDDEISARREELRQRALSGGYVGMEDIDARAMYIHLYEQETKVDANKRGTDTFFNSIAKDKFNVKFKKEVGGKKVGVVKAVESDKIIDFISSVEKCLLRPLQMITVV